MAKNFEFIKTRQGKRGIEWSSYLYTYDTRSIRSKTEYWRCSNRECGGRGKLLFDTPNFEETKVHTLCFPSAIRSESRKVLTEIKERSVSHLLETSGQTVEHVRANVDVRCVSALPKPESMRRAV